MWDPLPLPDPDSDELRALLTTQTQCELYGILYRSRDHPLTRVEIAVQFEALTGARQSQLDRRQRDLGLHFVIEKVRAPGEQAPRYVLAGRRLEPLADRNKLSKRERYEVLEAGRCAKCGRTPQDHHVVLQVDHKIPLAWGGTNDRGNLQALCEDCNAGKKDYFGAVADLGPAIARAVTEPEVHRRLASLLRDVAPEEVPSEALQIVANYGGAQEDWQKRLRELRELGWDYAPRRQKDAHGTVHVFYRLIAQRPLPEGPLRPHIRAAELAKKSRRGPGRAEAP